MHNLYLGTAKHMMKNVWLNDKNEFLSDEDFERIQELVDSMTVPQDIGCIPGKIACSFSGLYSRSVEKLDRNGVITMPLSLKTKGSIVLVDH